MKEELKRIIAGESSPENGLRLAREYLQSRILVLLQDAGAMMPMAFCGGTALRFLYGLQRFSEDLDFTLVKSDREFSMRRFMESTIARLRREGYAINPGWGSPEAAVQKVMLRFIGLPRELGLPARATANLSIRVETDTRPPAGAETQVTIVRRMHLIRIHHLDKPSLLAGKLHAVLTREYTKGRDFYDLLWYLGNPDWPGPNITYLGNALLQTGWSHGRVESLNLRHELELRFDSVDWAAVRRDVAPFLENPGETGFLNREDMAGLIQHLG